MAGLFLGNSDAGCQGLDIMAHCPRGRKKGRIWHAQRAGDMIDKPNPNQHRRFSRRGARRVTAPQPILFVGLARVTPPRPAPIKGAEGRCSRPAP
jgi:hypothetical protein